MRGGVRHLAALTLGYLILVSSNASPAPARLDGFPPEYRPGAIIAFTNSLIDAGEYYRAYAELSRLRALHPGALAESRLYTSELYLLFMGRQYRELAARKPAGAPDRLLGAIDAVFKADGRFARGDIAAADSIIRNRPELFGIDSTIDEYFVKRLLAADILLARRDAMREIADERLQAVNGIDVSKYRELMRYSGERLDALKSPAAAIACGIVPGMGYVYADRTGTGILALVVITIFSTFTYFAFNTHNEHIGIATGAIAGFFYGGSIVGGYLETKKYNRELMESLAGAVSEELMFEGDRRTLFRKHGIPR